MPRLQIRAFRWEPGEPRTRSVYIAIVSTYLALVTATIALGYSTFFVKSLVVPALLLLALLTNRFRAFCRDWLVFLAFTALFDGLRGLIYTGITVLDLPVYMNYAIQWERALLAGEVAPAALQRWLMTPGHVGLFERLMTLAHGSHFLVFLIFGLGIWSFAPAGFRNFRRAMMLLMGSGLVLYLLAPTVPPWMAHQAYGAIPTVYRAIAEIYNLEFGFLAQEVDVNPIAAMPSLHGAFPALCALIASHHLGWKSLPFFVYAAWVQFAVIYLGEHYLVDVLAGVLLAVLVFAAVYAAPSRWRALSRLGTASARRPVPLWPQAPPPLLVALLLMVGAEASVQLAQRYQKPGFDARSFYRRELAHRPEYQSLYAGIDAYRRGDCETALASFEAALPDLRARTDVHRAKLYIAECAFRAGDYGRTIELLSGIQVPMEAQAHLTLGLAYFRTGDYHSAARRMQRIVAHQPGHLEARMWLAASRYRSGETGPDEVVRLARRFDALPADPRARELRAILLEDVAPSPAGK